MYVLFSMLRLMGWWCHNRETCLKMTNGKMVFSSFILTHAPIHMYIYVYSLTHTHTHTADSA